MRGFRIADICWLKSGYGYQQITLPSHRVRVDWRKPVPPAIRLSHVKVWRRTKTGREFVARADTVSAARAIIRKLIEDHSHDAPCSGRPQDGH